MKFEKTSCCAFIISLVVAILIVPLCRAGTSSYKTSSLAPTNKGAEQQPRRQGRQYEGERQS
jgi:hypothetical protein